MNAAFSRVLASARAEFNRRFVEARHRYPELTPERFAAVLQGPGDAIVAAAEQAAPGSAGAVAQGVYDAALLLVGQRLAGPDARHPWIQAVWADVLPRLGGLVAAAPERLIAALSNAAGQVAATQGASPERWIGLMRDLGPSCGSIEELLALGQMAAWRSGLSHYRTGALAAADRLPAALALAVVDAPPGSDWPVVRTDLQRNVWHHPGGRLERARLRVAARVGAFRGFGGLFSEPPRIAIAQGHWLALADKSAWHLIADGWGATLHRAELPEDGSMPRPALGALPDGVRLQGAVLRRGREELDLSELGTLTSHALSSDGATLAVTGDGTHAVVLIALN
ncbi:MAG: hypothetical protein U1F61_30765 [Opitutaceae bacterium]